jgi:hypothetical protein
MKEKDFNQVLEITEQLKKTLELLHNIQSKPHLSGSDKFIIKSYNDRILYYKKKLENLGRISNICEIVFTEEGQSTKKVYFTDVTLELAQTLFQIYVPNFRGKVTYLFITPGEIISLEERKQIL